VHRSARFGAAFVTLVALGLVAAVETHPVSAQVPTATPTYSRDIGRYATAEISPLDVGRDSAGDWYVLDGGSACVQVYAPDGTTVIKTFFTCGVGGDDANHIGRARGFGLDLRTDDLWVADGPNKRVVKLNNQGVLQFSTTVPASPNGPLVDPRDVTVDSSGNAYITDDGWRIVKLSPTGQYLGQWGARGSGPGQMAGVTAIDFSAVGGDAVYASDAGNFRIAKFGLDGQWLGAFGSEGTGNGQFTRDARGVTVDQDGTIYAADVGGNRIVRWSASGTALSSLGAGLPYYQNGQGQLFYGARGIEAAGDVLAVSDTWNYRVQLWSLAGSFMGQLGGTPPPPDGHNGPHGVALDSAGNVYVSDYWHQWIEKFAPDGRFQARWGIGRGVAPGTLAFAGGIEVDNVRGRLYIANREGNVVDAWSLSDGTFVQRYPITGPLAKKGFPRDVAVNQSTGTIYVADEKNRQVDILAPGGSTLGVINKYGSGSGQSIGQPFAVCVDGQGDVYVGDYAKRLIDVYDSAGTWLRTFTPRDKPRGLDFENNTLYVLGGRKVATYTPTGALVSRWGTVGTGNNDLDDPYVGIAVDSAGNIYIGDSDSGRVKVFSP
jgi:tripartite motif-containing protein 71